MSAVTVTASNFHAANCHCDIAITGDVALTLQAVDVANLLVTPEDQDILGFLRCVTWLAKNGRTLGQAKTVLTNGVTVTV